MANTSPVTSISPVAGTITEVGVFDQNGNALAPSTIAWSAPVGESATSDMALLAALDPDGIGFDFEPSSSAPTESFTVVATHTPSGVSATLTINLTQAVSVVTALQFGILKGT